MKGKHGEGVMFRKCKTNEQKKMGNGEENRENDRERHELNNWVE